MGTDIKHWHVVMATPSDMMDHYGTAHNTFEAACYRMAEDLDVAANDVARFDREHVCSGEPCPTYGFSCYRRVTTSYRRMAEDFRAWPDRRETGPEPGGLTADWCRHRVAPCDDPACAPTQ